MRLDRLDLVRHLGPRLADFIAPAGGTLEADPPHRIDQPLRPLRRVSDDADIRRKPAHFGGIYVDADHLLPGRPVLPAHVDQLEPRPNADDEVRPRPQLVGVRQRQAELVRVAQNAAAAAEGDDRRIQRFGEVADFVRRGDRAAADHDHRMAARRDEPRRSGQCLRVGGRRRKRRQRIAIGDHLAAGEHVPRHFERRRPLPSGEHGLEGARHLHPRHRGRVDPPRPFREGAQGRELVRHFVQMTAAAAEKCRRHLSRDAKDRRVAAIGGEQRRAGIEHARPGHDRKGGRLAGRARVAEGHVAAGLLVARADDFQLRLGAVQRVEEAVDLRAGQAVDRVDAVVDEAGDDRLSAGHDS